MGSGVKYRQQNNNYIKIGIIALISLPILYLIYNWTSGDNSESFHYEMFSQRQSMSEPYLVDGKTIYSSEIFHSLLVQLN